MTGPGHYREAEQLFKHISGDPAHHPENMLLVGVAQVHATLALAAAVATGTIDIVSDWGQQWAEVIRP